MTAEERAKNIFNSDEILWLGPDRARLEKKIAQALRDQIEECAKILEEGSRKEKGLTDHAFRGEWRLGLCSCGLQKEAHPRAMKTRKQIIKEIRALAASTSISIEERKEIKR